MAGRVLQVFNKQVFNFSGATAGEFVVVRSMDVSAWQEGVLCVRVHANSMSTAGANVVAYPISLSAEEPQTDFLDAANTTVSIGTGDGAGTLLRTALGSNFGGALQIRVAGASGSTGDLTISCELVLKD